MIGPALLLLGSYLAASPGGDMFMLPKLFCVFLGAFLCLWRSWRPAQLRPWFLLWIAAMALSAQSAQSWLGLHRSPTVGILGAVAIWLSYEAGLCCGTRAWRWITVGAAICSLLALVQLVPACPFHGLVPNGRAIGPIGSPPYLGCMLALAAPLSVSFASPVILLALFAARSKAAIIGLFAGLAIRFRIPTWAIGIVAVTAVLLMNRHDSDTMRIYIWGIAWKTFLTHPLLGVGADNFGDAFIAMRGPAWIEAGGMGLSAAENAHNLILNILATGGLVGLAARGLLAWKCWPIIRRDNRVLAAYASVLAYGMFNPIPFTAWAVLAFMLGTL